MLISEKLRVSLCEIIGECFEMNRFLDRGMSLLDTKWVLKNCSKELHPVLAHAFLGDKFADSIGEYLGSRNALVDYPATSSGVFDFDKPVEFFVEFLKKMISFQNLLYDVRDEAVEEGDHTTKLFVNGLIKTAADFTEQAQLLVDLFNKYGNTECGLLMLDTEIDDYITV